MNSYVQPNMSEGARQSAWIAGWSRDWHSVARYSILRSEFGKPKRVIHEGLAYHEAKGLCPSLDDQACAEVGCRRDAFGRPIHYLQLEKPEETRQKFLLLRNEPEGETIDEVHV
jgi:hypothetical protein